MRFGEITFAPDIEQILDAVEVEEERVAAAAGEKCVSARLDDVRLGAEGDLGTGDDLRADRFGRARIRALRQEYVDGLPAVLRRREHIAERDVGKAIAVGIDVDAVDCVGMQRVRIGICIENDRGPAAVGGRLERVQVAEVEPLIAQRRAEAQSGEMVRHGRLLSEDFRFGGSLTGDYTMIRLLLMPGSRNFDLREPRAWRWRIAYATASERALGIAGHENDLHVGVAPALASPPRHSHD